MADKFDLKPVLKAINPEDVIAYFRQKGYRIGFDYRDVWQQEHQAGFTVAKAMQIDLLTEIRGFVDAAIADGSTLATFQKELMPRLVKRGWWGKAEMVDPLTGETKLVQLGSPRRLETIFDTNLATAYSEGQWERIQRNKELFPFLEYVRSASVNPRHTHLAYAGLVLRADDSFWQTHLPIKEFKCKCTVIQHSQRMLDREGLKVGKAPPEVMRTVVNKRTGEVMTVPTGVHPAFHYPPGGRRAHLEKMLADKQQAFVAGAKSPGKAAAALAADQARQAGRAMAAARTVHQVHRMDVAPAAMDKITRATGLALAGYLSVFDTSAVGHVLKNHGAAHAEAGKKQLPVQADDFRHEPLIVNEADTVALSGRKTATEQDAIVFTKVIEGNTYVLVKEVRTKRRHLATKTLYIKSGAPKPGAGQ